MYLGVRLLKLVSEKMVIGLITPSRSNTHTDSLIIYYIAIPSNLSRVIFFRKHKSSLFVQVSTFIIHRPGIRKQKVLPGHILRKPLKEECVLILLFPDSLAKFISKLDYIKRYSR